MYYYASLSSNTEETSLPSHCTSDPLVALPDYHRIGPGGQEGARVERDDSPEFKDA